MTVEDQWVNGPVVKGNERVSDFPALMKFVRSISFTTFFDFLG